MSQINKSNPNLQKQYQFHLNNAFLQALHAKHIFLSEEKEDTFFIKQMKKFNLFNFAGNFSGLLGIYLVDRRFLAAKYGDEKRGLLIRLLIGLSVITLNSVWVPKLAISLTEFESSINQISLKYENFLLQLNPGLYQMKYGVLPIVQQRFGMAQPPFQQQQWQQQPQPYQYSPQQPQRPDYNEGQAPIEQQREQYYQSNQEQPDQLPNANLQHQGVINPSYQGYQQEFQNQHNFQQFPGPSQQYQQNPPYGYNPQKPISYQTDQPQGFNPNVENQQWPLNQQDKPFEAQQRRQGYYQQYQTNAPTQEKQQEETQYQDMRQTEKKIKSGEQNFGYLRPSSNKQ